MRRALQSVMLAPPSGAGCHRVRGRRRRPNLEQSGSAPPASEAKAVLAGVAMQYATMEKEIREAGGEQTVGFWRN